MTITGRHVGAARVLLGLSPSDLAALAGVHPKTVLRFEGGKHEPIPATLKAIVEALEHRGIEFMNGGEPGVRLRPSKAKKPGTY